MDYVGINTNRFANIWIIGGERLYRECIANFLPYCKKILIGKIKNENYDCDLFFPIGILEKYNINKLIDRQCKDYQIVSYHPNIGKGL